MGLLSTSYRSTSTTLDHTGVILAAVSIVGWLIMGGMLWNLSYIVPISEFGPGMAWFSAQRFSEYTPSGMSRFLDTLCIAGDDPRSMLMDTGHVVAMWVAMMVAMMTPVAQLDLKAELALRKDLQPYGLSGWLLGFLSAWVLAAMVGAVLQVLLYKFAVLGDGMIVSVKPLGGLLLLFAGAYQFTPWKVSHLRPCAVSSAQPPVMGGWSAGWRSVRCCWALMIVMFALGVMNIVAAGALTVLMVSERSSRFGKTCASMGGAVLVISAIMILSQG